MKIHPKSLSLMGKWLFLILTIGVTACDKEEMPNSEPDPEEETIVHTMAPGDYKGFWNSKTPTVTYTNLPISARIVKTSDGKYEGEFFINESFFGNHVGIISFSIEENKVNNFKWGSIILNCTGTFTGSGRLVAQNSFSITINGTDCDGTHAGTIKLKME